MNWQPIETAPKDGTTVLVRSPDWDEPGVEIARFLEFEGDPDPGQWWPAWDERSEALEGVTEWAPIPGANDWQPIETAPRDGSDILIETRSREGGVALVVWDSDLPEPAFIDETGDSYFDATGWQPLPKGRP